MVHARRHASTPTIEPEVVAHEACVQTHGPTTIPTHSPWGPCQEHEVMAPGIVQVSTAGHGGIHVDQWRLAQMPAPLRALGGGKNWFEEDCNWAAPVIAFRAELPPAPGRRRHRHPAQLAPDAYEAHFKEVIPPGASYIKDQATFQQQHANDLHVTTAFSADSARERFGIPITDRQVLVFAVRGGDRSLFRAGASPQECGVFLVDHARYRARGSFSHIIDPAIDTALDAAATARCMA